MHLPDGTLVHVCSIESTVRTVALHSAALRCVPAVTGLHLQLVARVAAGWVQKPAKAKAAVEDSEFVDETDALISGLEAIQVGNRYARCCAKAFRTESDSLIGCFVCRTAADPHVCKRLQAHSRTRLCSTCAQYIGSAVCHC